MYSSNCDKIIRDFSAYFNVSVKDVSFKENGKVPSVQTSKCNVQGLRNIVSHVQNEPNPELKAVQDQWIEYSLTHGLHSDVPSTGMQILKEVNEYMADRVYFVGQKSGPTDILMYYFLYNVVSSLSFQEKEKYLHVCRWFNTIQQDKTARLGRSEVPFSRTRLYV